MIGKSIGAFQVVAKLGEGGMGEVYRARDSKLDREVAIKILPSGFVSDADRVARFHREAKTLAALNHPNIAAIYGFEDRDGTAALILELIEGPTLADRLAGGAIPIDDALPIARQIVDALEAAHDSGIVHRDLKPANIKLRPDGTVKVLDFGLAKALEPAGALPGDATVSPTITSPALTQMGVILGTAAYMSPEQAKGRPADKRSDVWAFGCVLYEMLTGQRPFAGDDISDTLAAVLRAEPDWRALPADTPPSIRRLLRRCLEKDRKRRLSDSTAARLEIDDALTPLAEVSTQTASQRSRRAWIERLTWSVVALSLLAVVAWLLWRGPVNSGPTRVMLTVPSTLSIQGGGGDRLLAISPDGRSIAFVGTSAGTTQIYLRRVDQFDAVPVRGTEGGVDPFFSPDGQWLGFLSGVAPSGGVTPSTEGTLSKVPIGGGPATTLSHATNRGASWGPDNTIVFATSATSGLSRVSASGGPPELLTKLDPSERSHRWPSFLPGGKAVLFSIQPAAASFDEALIAVRLLDTGEQRIVARGGSTPVYVPTGHVIFGRAGSLLAVPFDLQRLEATGPAVPILEGVAMNTATGAGQYAIGGGSIVYMPGIPAASRRELLWVDRQGIARTIGAEALPYFDLSLSPDGQQIAVAIVGQNQDIWIYEIARDTLRRLTFASGLDTAPIWTPDGRHVTFNGVRTGAMEIFQLPVDGSGSEERLIGAGSLNAQARSWHPSEKWLAYDLAADIYVLPMTGDRKPTPFLASQFTEALPAFSPDGRWIAYQSNETGRFEIYVQPFPGPGGKWQVSADGGLRPKWSHDGRELYFRAGGRMMAAPIDPGPRFVSRGARPLFEGQYAPPYDVAADGRFLMVRDEGQSDPTQLRLVLNWLDEVRRVVQAQ